MDTCNYQQNRKKAYEAWHNGGRKTFFASDAKLFDDGNPGNSQKFVKDACRMEKCTCIEKVENDGKDITGNFHTKSWGYFKTYFRFHIDMEGNITRLDVEQAD